MNRVRKPRKKVGDEESDGFFWNMYYTVSARPDVG